MSWARSGSRSWLSRSGVQARVGVGVAAGGLGRGVGADGGLFRSISINLAFLIPE